MTKAFRLLAIYSLSFWKNDAWKFLSTMLGLSLGLALYSGVQIANRAALSSFEDSAALLRGGSDLEISAVSGEVPEALIRELRNLEFVASLEPLSRRTVEARSDADSLGAVQVLGINVLGTHQFAKKDSGSAPRRVDLLSLLRMRRAVWISAALGKELNGRPLQLSRGGESITVDAVYTLPENALLPGKQVIFDIASFQDFFEVYGFVDSLQVFLKPGESPAFAIEALSRRLGESFIIDAQGQNARHAKKMTEAFRLNLQFLSGISVFVALLLIYNTVSFFVLKRRKDFGILQSIGASPKDVKLLLLFEAVFLGLSGAALGLVLGRIAGAYTLNRVGATLQQVYGQSGSLDASLSWALVLEVFLLGPLLSIIGSSPARELSSVPLRETFSYQTFELTFGRRIPYYSFISLLFFILCFFSADPRFLSIDTRFGFLSPTLAVLSICFLVPAFLYFALRLLRRIKRLPLAFLLASDHVQSTLRRNSVAVASVAVALGMSFSMAIMIVSFRQTVSRWIGAVTKADLFISGELRNSPILGHTLSKQFIDALLRFPEVKDYDPVAGRTFDFQGRLMRLVGCRMEVVAESDRLLFLKPMSDSERREAAARPDTVFVSEVFARRTKKSIGDSLEVPGKFGSFRGTIANIFYDYSSDQGVVMLSLENLEKLYGPVPLQGVALYLRSPADAEKVSNRLQEQYPELQLRIRNNLDLRKEVLRVFDETFRITYALQLIALFVSAAALMNTLSMLALERKREFAVIRAIGASSRTLLGMVVAEASLVGFAGLLAGLFLGFSLSLILVFVVNTHFFGWSIAYQLPLQPLLAGSVFTLLLSLATGLIQGRKLLIAVREETLRYE